MGYLGGGAEDPPKMPEDPKEPKGPSKAQLAIWIGGGAIGLYFLLNGIVGLLTH